MAETCQDCGRLKADRLPDVISPKGPCSSRWHSVGADDCMALTLVRLRARIAELEQQHEEVTNLALSRLDAYRDAVSMRAEALRERDAARERVVELEQKQAERGHLEEARRLLLIEWTSVDRFVLAPERYAWLEAERSRKATSGGG